MPLVRDVRERTSEDLDAAPLVDVGDLDGDRVEDLFASVLLRGVGGLLRRGLFRGYEEYEDVLRGPRGRIDMTAMMSRPLEHGGRAACRFDELTPDVLANQLIRATLRRVASSTTDENGLALERLASRMRGVADIEPRPPLFSRVPISRSNTHYAFLLPICELACRSLVPDARGTDRHRFEDFRENEQVMGKLFERFVRVFLERELDQGVWTVAGRRIPWDATAITPGSAAVLPTMNTDIEMRTRNRRVVVEVKFYRTPLRVGPYGGPPRLREKHLYQLFAYLENLRLSRCPAHAGVLLYGTSGQTIARTFRIGSHEVHVRSLDLAQPWPAIRASLLGLAASFEHAGAA